jgi:hypothetical protein
LCKSTKVHTAHHLIMAFQLYQQLGGVKGVHGAHGLGHLQCDHIQTNKTSNACIYGRLKLQTFLTGSRTFHLDACIFMEHAHPLYAHIVFSMSVTHWMKLKSKTFIPKSYTNTQSLPHGQSQQTTSSLCNDSTFMIDSNFKPKLFSLSKTFHLDAFTYMEHAR